MNATELVAALNTVEQDHRLVLDKVQALKEAVCCLVDPEGAGLRRAVEHGTRESVSCDGELIVFDHFHQAAERHDADLIVLGRHGRSGLAAALIGSSARAVAQRCPRPVLLVPEARKDA